MVHGATNCLLTQTICYLTHQSHGNLLHSNISGIILCMHPANERWCYNVTSSLIGCVHSQDDPCILHWVTGDKQLLFIWKWCNILTICHCYLLDKPKGQHIVAKTKWPPFCRRHFQINFLVWKCLYFDSNFNEIYYQGLTISCHWFR